MAVDGRWFGFAKIKGESLRFIWFNLMPWPYLPDDFREKYRSVWVDIPSSLYDKLSVGLSIGHWFADERIPALLRVLRV